MNKTTVIKRRYTELVVVHTQGQNINNVRLMMHLIIDFISITLLLQQRAHLVVVAPSSSLNIVVFFVRPVQQHREEDDVFEYICYTSLSGIG